MDPAALRVRTTKFAVDAIRFARRLPNDRIRNRIIGQIETLNEAELSPRSDTDPLWQEADELVRILVRSRETAPPESLFTNHQLIT